ncbi:tRNA adenosine deaminase-associated protein [Catellatospora sp. KI3]|uniref:tRNA adenosine deaminase-associated protein n=1 Tax=Catellatospora sp. KI3 TaxID=3041620 RepID=UPI002483037E|nr:tRNA adenosine deaminase-associated protein [Catellatospora sp. KI3]MDI1461798.1 tRNA adenosine deaminase-associated protein [Catellatospora sp. KI3]
MSYFAAAVVRGRSGWAASELDLHDAADVDEVADLLREAEPNAAVHLMFVESDDAYLVIMRLDEGEDLRIFGSDSAFADESRLGKLLLGEVETPVVEIEESGSGDADDDDRPAADPVADPVGDADLLADLGVSAHKLLALCATDGLMPADVTAEVCQAIGCGDEVEELRES